MTFLFGSLKGFYKHLAKFLNVFSATHFLGEQWHTHNMEVLIQVINLLEVFLLHLVSDVTMLTIGSYMLPMNTSALVQSPSPLTYHPWGTTVGSPQCCECRYGKQSTLESYARSRTRTKILKCTHR